MRIPVVLSLALAIVLAASGAGAQSSEELAARRDLVDRATTASQAGRHDAALDLARRADSIRPSPSLRMFIAQEEVALGQVAAAFGDADACVHDATRDTAMANRAAVIARCGALVTELRQRLGHLVVHAPRPAPNGLHVTVAGAALDPALFDVGSVVTPGTVHIDATADGVPPFARDVPVPAGGDVEVTVVFAEAAPAATATPAATHSTPARTVPAPSNGGSVRSTVGIAVAIGGVVIAGLGGLFYGLGVREANAYNNDPSCPGSAAPNQGTCQAHLSAGSLYGVLAPVGFAVGGVLVAGGVVLFVTAPRQHSDRGVASLRCGPGPSWLGASCGVRF